jgi:hypothetical protein
MTALLATQRAFLDALLGRGDGAIAALADGPRNDAATLFGIYRDAYGLRLVEALGQDFPALAALLGEDGFDRMARDYLAAHPSRSHTVRELGRRLPAFLALDSAWRSDPTVADLARFEWALREVFDEAADDPLEFATVAATAAADWPERRFAPVTALRRLALGAGIPAFWQAVESGDGAPPRPAGGDIVEWIVWRADLLREFRSMPEDEAWMFDAMAEGVPFAALCEGMGRWHAPEAAASRAAGLLRAWIDHGMLAADR